MVQLGCQKGMHERMVLLKQAAGALRAAACRWWQHRCPAPLPVVRIQVGLQSLKAVRKRSSMARASAGLVCGTMCPAPRTVAYTRPR